MIPDEVRVGPAIYRVRLKKPLPMLCGQTVHEKNLIRLSANQAPPSMRDTLLHEVLHGVFWTGGLGSVFDIGKDEEEKLVRALTPWVLGLIRDNPELVTFLQEA